MTHCVTCKQTGPTTIPGEEHNESERQTKRVSVGQPAVSKYFGESGYGGNTRGRDHQTSVAKRDKTNALWRHCELYHGGETAEFTMSVLATSRQPYIRRIREGLHIVAGEQDILLNSKEEYLQGAIPYTRFQRGFGR